MIYRVGLGKTNDGYLKLTASAKGTPTLVAIQLDPYMRAVAARIAKVKEEDVQELISSHQKLGRKNDLDFCCEAIDLTPTRLKIWGSLRIGDDSPNADMQLWTLDEHLFANEFRRQKG